VPLIARFTFTCPSPDALRDAHDESRPASTPRGCVSRERRGTKMTRRSRRSPRRFRDGVEIGTEPSNFSPPCGRDAADDLRAVGHALLRVESPVLPVMPCTRTLVSLFTQTLTPHSDNLLDRCGCTADASPGDLQAGVRQDFLPEIHVRALEANDERDLQVELFAAFTTPFAMTSHFMMRERC